MSDVQTLTGRRIIIFMNTLLPFLLMSLALLAGCSSPAPESRPGPRELRVNGSGEFTLTNVTGTVFWGHVQDSKTNDLQFILLLPEAVECGGGNQTHADFFYDYCHLKTRRDGHQWKIEAVGNLNTGTDSLRLSDVTANTATTVDLRQSRTWHISDDGILIPLNEIDPRIKGRGSAEV